MPNEVTFKAVSDEQFLKEMFKYIEASAAKESLSGNSVTINFGKNVYSINKERIKAVFALHGLVWNKLDGWSGEKGSVVANFDDRSQPVFKVTGEKEVVNDIKDLCSIMNTKIEYDNSNVKILDDELPYCYKDNTMKMYAERFYKAFFDWCKNRGKTQSVTIKFVVFLITNKTQAIQDYKEGKEISLIHVNGWI